ncbi:DUF3224 domain-containing protein [Deinococcus altitudinis]|uniref:DUF3224 domain-containing protein n=1 Tax=Deinococcus altitudinis TaxID=468914 RepID=UPI0038916922
MMQAKGSFEVTLAPQAGAEQEGVGRLLLSKVFHGDLKGAGSGQMLSVGTSTPDSAGYVAMETVQGSLHGRTGGFALQHNGTMNRGTPTLSVAVVPDSGTDQLTGLTGTMTIDRQDGQHFYVLNYELPTSE